MIHGQSSARTSQQRQGSLDQCAARQGTPATGQGSLDSGSLDPHASQQGSLNPPVAGTGSLDPGSLDQRASSQRTRATKHGSFNSGPLDPHASQQGSLDPPVAGTGSLDPGSLNQRVVSPRTNRSSVSFLSSSGGSSAGWDRFCRTRRPTYPCSVSNRSTPCLSRDKGPYNCCGGVRYQL